MKKRPFARKKYSKPTAIDVFCGCGGTTQGLRDAGFNVIAGIEKDELAVSTYRQNHKRVQVWNDDIKDISPEMLMECHQLHPGNLDLLVGCPPCQAFSPMRHLNGKRHINDHNKNLIFEFLRFVEGLMPKVIMIENVPHLVKDGGFNKVKKKLENLEYVGSPAVFDAADFGIPQRRKRVIFITSRIGAIQNTDTVSNQYSQTTVRDAIGSLPSPGKSGDALHDFPENRSPRIKKLIRSIPKDGGSRKSLGVKRQLECHKNCDGFKDVYGRMAWDKVAPTITSGCTNPSKGRFLHPDQDRAITLREAALLQNFPKDYSFPLDRGKSAVALMIGNAFPPQMVKHHALNIRKHIHNSNKRQDIL